MLATQIFYPYFVKKVLSANSILQFDFRFLSIALTAYEALFIHALGLANGTGRADEAA